MEVPFQAFSDLGFECDKYCNIKSDWDQQKNVYVQLGILSFMCIGFTVGRGDGFCSNVMVILS